MPNATGRPNGRFRGVTARGKRGGHGEEASCDRSGPRTDRWFFCNDAGMAEPIVESREARVQQEEADFARLVRSGAPMPGDRAPTNYRRLLRPALWVAVIAAIPVGGIAGLIFGGLIPYLFGGIAMTAVGRAATRSSVARDSYARR